MMKMLDPRNTNHILIGLGGTGGSVLKAFRQRLYKEFPHDEERNRLAIGFLYVDQHQDIPFTESEFVDMKANNLMLENVSHYPGLKAIVKDWDSMKTALSGISIATGQKRIVGRLLFAAHCKQYLSALKEQYDKVKFVSKREELTIHIFTGLGGVTGSGAIIDMVAQTRAQEVYKQADIIVHALLPQSDITGHQAELYYPNAYAALKELNALNIGRWAPMDVVSGEGRIELNPMLSHQFQLMLYSNVNEKGVTVGSFAELPQLVVDNVYFTLFLHERASSTHFIGAYNMESICDYCVEYSEKSPGLEKVHARTKAIGALGIKRIIYAEKRILERITYTVGERMLLQMLYNNFKDDLGFVKEWVPKEYREQYLQEKNLRDWMLDDSHLMLEEKILETDKHCCNIEYFWDDIAHRHAYADAQKADADPLRSLENFCADAYAHAFRKKLGVEDYYQEQSHDEVLREQAQVIVGRMEKSLYAKWHEGALSLEDLLKICNTVLTYLSDRKEKLESDKTVVDEKINVSMNGADANHHKYHHLSLIQCLMRRTFCLYADHQQIMKELYTLRTMRVAYEFEEKLLEKLRIAVEGLSAEIRRFIGVLMQSMEIADQRIAGRNELVNGITDLSGAIVEVREDEKVMRLEQELMLEKFQLEAWSGSIRHAIAGKGKGASFRELSATMTPDSILEIFEEELSPKIRETHELNYQKDGVLGLNVLQQLQKTLLTDEDIRNFASSVMEQSGTLLQLDDEQLSKVLKNNYNPVTRPESMARKVVLVSMPGDEGSDSLKVFTDKLKDALKRAFGNSAPGSAIEFYTGSERRNEITVASIRFCFPMRALSCLPAYERAYNAAVGNANRRAAKAAQKLLHSEDYGTDLPELMGEKFISPQEFVPYLFLAAVNDILALRENEWGDQCWHWITTDEWGTEALVLIAYRFSEIPTSEALTDEVMDAIKKQVDDLLKNPEWTSSERVAMKEGVKAIVRDCMQYEADAMKAIAMIHDA